MEGFTAEMEPGSPKRNTAEIVAWALIVVFSIAAAFIVIQEVGKETPGEQKSDPSAYVSLAKEYEEKGDISRALSFYRKAIEIKPTLCDPRSRDYLGENFEKKIDRWIKELKGGDGEGSKKALKDASFIFRKLHGGCG